MPESDQLRIGPQGRTLREAKPVEGFAMRTTNAETNRRSLAALLTGTLLATLLAVPVAGCGDGEDLSSSAVAGVTQEDANRVSGTIGPAGGTLQTTASDDTRYTLTSPANALPSAREIAMTPVTAIGGYPLAGGPAAGVALEPSGTVFAAPASLVIETSKAAPAGSDSAALFATYRSCFAHDALPALEGATDDLKLATAIGKFVMWKEFSRQALGPELFATFDDSAETTQYHDILAGKLQAAIDRNNHSAGRTRALPRSSTCCSGNPGPRVSGSTPCPTAWIARRSSASCARGWSSPR